MVTRQTLNLETKVRFFLPSPPPLFAHNPYLCIIHIHPTMKKRVVIKLSVDDIQLLLDGCALDYDFIPMDFRLQLED